MILIAALVAAQVTIAAGHNDARGKSCHEITRGFDSWGNQDDWVSEFPAYQQRRVVKCLTKKWKRENPGAR